jgi:hypothetical protein
MTTSPSLAQPEIQSALISEAFASAGVVERFDARGQINVFYATFTTKTAGMPFMATMIARLPA